MRNIQDKFWGHRSNIDINNEKDQNDSPEVVQIQTEEKIEVVGNKVFFYAEVYRDTVLKLNKELTNLANQIIYQSVLTNTEPYPIRLYIQSYGGIIHAGLSALDFINSLPVPVETVIDGSVASAATFFSIAGHKRYMMEHGLILIHQLSSGFWGKFDDMEDEMENSKNLMKTIKDIYKEYTNIPMKELDEILKRDIWMDAKSALKYGLVDEIITPKYSRPKIKAPATRSKTRQTKEKNIASKNKS